MKKVQVNIQYQREEEWVCPDPPALEVSQALLDMPTNQASTSKFMEMVFEALVGNRRLE